MKSVGPSARVEGLQPKDQVGTWQLTSIDVHCGTSAVVSMIVKKVTEARMCAHTCP